MRFMTGRLLDFPSCPCHHACCPAPFPAPVAAPSSICVSSSLPFPPFSFSFLLFSFLTCPAQLGSAQLSSSLLLLPLLPFLLLLPLLFLLSILLLLLPLAFALAHSQACTCACPLSCLCSCLSLYAPALSPAPALSSGFWLSSFLRLLLLFRGRSSLRFASASPPAPLHLLSPTLSPSLSISPLTSTLGTFKGAFVFVFAAAQHSSYSSISIAIHTCRV